MGYKIGDLFWKIEADTTDFDKGAKKTETTAKGMGKSLTSVGKLVTAGFTVAIVAGIGKISKELVNAASEAEETRNKFNVVFQDVSDAATASATNLSENFGLSRTAAQGLLSDTGDLLTGFGFTGEAALDLSTQVNELAVDLASFTNFSGGAEGASQALTKALLGERESVKALGISILDADVKAKVLELTQQGLTFESERQAKAQATLAIAIEQSGNAIGDFERSSDSYANQVRIAGAATDDLKTALGENLLPAATNIVSAFAEVTRSFADYVVAANEAKVASENLLDTARGTGGDTVAAIVELENRISSVRTAMNGSRGDLLKLARQYDFNTKNVEAYVKSLELDLEVRKQYQAVRDANTKAQEEEAQAQLDAAEAQETANNELQAYLDLVNSEYAETQQGKIDALAEEIALWEAYEETAVNTLPQIKAILEELRDEYESLTEVTEDYNDAFTAGSDARIDAYREELRLAIMTENAIAGRTSRQQAYANAIIESTNFWATESAAVIDALYTYELGALDAKLNNQEISEEEYNTERNKILKKQAIADKVVSLFEIGINTASNIVESYPNPFLMAAAGILGAAQAGLVAATPIPSFETGGIVPGTSYTGDNVPANVNSGEMILNKQQQAQLFNMANNGGGGSQTINIQLDKKTIATAVVSAVNAGQGGVISKRVIQ